VETCDSSRAVGIFSLVFDRGSRSFHGAVPYKNRIAASWNYIRY